MNNSYTNKACQIFRTFQRLEHIDLMVVLIIFLHKFNLKQTIHFVLKVEDLKDLTEVVEVPLTDEFQTTYNYVENNIKSYLVQLQENGCVASSYTADNLIGDYTRFVLKQEEKKKSDLSNTDQTYNDKKYKMLICLHTLVTTAELIRECGIAVAQGIRTCLTTVSLRKFAKTKT